MHKNPTQTLALTRKKIAKKQNKDVFLYSLRNQLGTELQLSNMGASIISLTTANHGDIIVGNKDPLLIAPAKNYPYFGSTIGVLAGRTSTKPFPINNHLYQPDANEGPHVSLHGGGGDAALCFRVWDAEEIHSATHQGLVFTTIATASNTAAIISCAIALEKTKNNLHIEYVVESCMRFPVNLTNHSYFTLGGSDVLNYTLQIPATHVYTLDAHGLCTGDLRDISNTPLNFRNPTTLRDPIEALKPDRGGIDHVFKLERSSRARRVHLMLTEKKLALHSAALLRSPENACMEVYTSSPALVCYTGNFLADYTDGERRYRRFEAICFETQYAAGFTHLSSLPQSYAEKKQAWVHCTEYRITGV